MAGMSGPMLWLQNCLNRTAKDQEVDGKKNICISLLLVDLTLFTWFYKGIFVRSIQQECPRLYQSSLWRRQMKTQWKIKPSLNCCANWDWEHLRTNRYVFVVSLPYNFNSVLWLTDGNLPIYAAFRSWDVSSHTGSKSSNTELGFSTVVLPGEILENTRKDDCIPAPECSSCSLSSSWRT